MATEFLLAHESTTMSWTSHRSVEHCLISDAMAKFIIGCVLNPIDVPAWAVIKANFFELSKASKDPLRRAYVRDERASWLASTISVNCTQQHSAQ